MGRYKIFSFWTHWPNCGLVVAKNVRGWWFLTIIWNTDHCFVYTGLVSLQKLFDLSQLMVSNHYLGYWSQNPLHMWCVHWLGEFSYFWWKLAKFGLSGGRKMAAVGGFGQLFRILIIEITSYWLGEFLKKMRFLAKYQHSGGQKWPKLMFYDNWIVSWHFLAMSTVCLWRLIGDATIRFIDLLVLIYMLTHLLKNNQETIDEVGLSDCSDIVVVAPMAPI